MINILQLKAPLNLRGTRMKAFHTRNHLKARLTHMVLGNQAKECHDSNARNRRRTPVPFSHAKIDCKYLFYIMYRCFACIKVCSKRSLSNDDGDFNENGMKRF